MNQMQRKYVLKRISDTKEALMARLRREQCDVKPEREVVFPQLVSVDADKLLKLVTDIAKEGMSSGGEFYNISPERRNQLREGGHIMIYMSEVYPNIAERVRAYRKERTARDKQYSKVFDKVSKVFKAAQDEVMLGADLSRCTDIIGELSTYNPKA